MTARKTLPVRTPTPAAPSPAAAPGAPQSEVTGVSRAVPAGVDWSAAVSEAVATARTHGVELSLMEALHLATLREAVRRGELTEQMITPNDPRVAFARWLVQEGRLSG